MSVSASGSILMRLANCSGGMAGVTLVPTRRSSSGDWIRPAKVSPDIGVVY